MIEGCLHAFCLDCILQWAAHSSEPAGCATAARASRVSGVSGRSAARSSQARGDARSRTQSCPAASLAPGRSATARGGRYTHTRTHTRTHTNKHTHTHTHRLEADAGRAAGMGADGGRHGGGVGGGRRRRRDATCPLCKQPILRSRKMTFESFQNLKLLKSIL